MKYKVIIFDIGDTLLEYSPSQVEIYAKMFKNIGIDIPKRLYKSIKKLLNETSYKQIAKEIEGAPRMDDDDFKQMIEMALILYINENIIEINGNNIISKIHEQKMPDSKLVIMPNTFEILNLLSKNNYRLGIVSNHKKWMLKYLKEIDLAKYFECIIISEIIGYEKPDERIMLYALEQLGSNAKDCLYIGDHPFDVLCSKKAGIDCAWLTNKNNTLPLNIYYKEDYKIETILDLRNILGINDKQNL
jgi:HAD superfamily hydrolase (TIGR01509 family)